MGLYVWIVMAALLAIGLTAGFLMHRSDFCLAGAFRDIFLFKSYRRIRPLVLLITLSALLFELLRLVGILPIYPFPWFGPPAAANILGGMLFGVGMVLAGGCVVGVLYKMGGGNSLALVAFMGLLAGSALYAEIHGWWSALAGRSVVLSQVTTLPQWLGVSPIVPVLALAAVGCCCCWRWLQKGLWRQRNAAQGAVPLWLAAVGLAVLGTLTVLLCGMPMGVTTTYAKGAALLESWLIPGHFSGLAYFAALPVKHALPFDGVLRTGGAGPYFDIITIVQLPLILGIAGGGWLSAQLLGEFRPGWRAPFRQVAMVFVGGIIMALGSRMSPGCNVWHLLGGVPLLTMQSMLFVAGLIPGTWLGSEALQRIVLSGSSVKRLVHEDA